MMNFELMDLDFAFKEKETSSKLSEFLDDITEDKEK